MSTIIDNERLKNICKAGQGSECCRYIIAGIDGIQCGKHTSLKEVLDKRVSSMSAKSDNCEGLYK